MAHQAQHILSRRTFLKGTGAVIVMVVGGTIWRANDQGVFSAGTGPAYEPWTTWQTDQTSGPLALVSSAILAANPHNTQPWLFRVTDAQIEVFADTSRHLGAMDPYLREMHTGLGAAIENMVLTAEAIGYTVDLTLNTGELTGPTADLEPVQVATVSLSGGTAAPSPLYEAIPNRHTDRSAYDTARPVTPETLAAIHALAQDESDVDMFFFTQREAKFDTFVAETVRATEWIIADAEMSHDSHAWFRATWDEVQAQRDGVYIDTSGVGPLARATVKILPPMPTSMLDSGWLSGTQTSLAATSILGLVAVRNLYDKPQTLQAGRIWQRMHLWGTANGLAMQPINQMPEVVDRERQLGQEARMARILDELTAEPDWRPTFAFRLGYPTDPVLPSARRWVQDVLL